MIQRTLNRKERKKENDRPDKMGGFKSLVGYHINRY